MGQSFLELWGTIVDMAAKHATNFTFVLFEANQGRSQRARELADSEARSHAATVAHRRARHRKEKFRSQLEQHKSTEVSSSALSPTVFRDHKGNASADEKSTLSTAYCSDQDSSLSPILLHGRSIDWYLDPKGLYCRPITTFDNAAIQYFRRNGPERWPGANFKGEHQSRWEKVLPVSDELVRQGVTTETALLDSIVAYTAFAMMNGNPNAHILRVFAQKAVLVALRSLQDAIANPEQCEVLVLPYAVLHLCMAAISMGDLDAAYVHLKFITEATRDLIPTTDYEYRFVFMMRGIDMRYAIQSGKPPVSMYNVMHRLATEKDSSNDADFGIHNHTNTALSSHKSSNSNIDGLARWRSISWQLMDLDGTEAYPSPHITGHGLHTSIKLGLIPLNLLPNVNLYLDAITYLSEITRLERIQTVQRLIARDKCYTSIERLCAYWSFTRLTSTPSRYPPRNSNELSIRDAVVIALQLRLVMSLGRWGGHTLTVLCQRLRPCIMLALASAVSKDTSLNWTESDDLLSKLLLWILLVAMLGTLENSDQLSWFRDNAMRHAAKMSIVSEHDWYTVMTLFSPAGCSPGDDMVEIVRTFI